jgi:hypothetical protein
MPSRRLMFAWLDRKHGLPVEDPGYRDSADPLEARLRTLEAASKPKWGRQVMFWLGFLFFSGLGGAIGGVAGDRLYVGFLDAALTGKAQESVLTGEARARQVEQKLNAVSVLADMRAADIKRLTAEKADLKRQVRLLLTANCVDPDRLGLQPTPDKP